jgi:hypothetical protein
MRQSIGGNLLPKNFDQIDFSKPEKFLREIFDFLQDHIVFS